MSRRASSRAVPVLERSAVVRAVTRRSRVLVPSDPALARRTPVVLVHGIGMSPRSFHRLQAHLAEHRPTLAIALPGFGSTRSPGERFGTEGYADVVAAELRRRGIGRADLVGQSMGTQVVVETALRHPDLVRSLTLVGPVVDAARDTAVQQAVGLARDGLHEGVRMNAVVLTDYLRSVRQYLHELGPMLRFPMLDRIARVGVPVVVVRGASDPIARAPWAVRVAGAARHGRLVVVPGPHHVQESAPRAVAAAVLALEEARADDATTERPADATTERPAGTATDRPGAVATHADPTHADAGTAAP